MLHPHYCNRAQKEACFKARIESSPPVGERIFESDWLSEHERKSPTEKLELLAEKLNITYNVKTEPWVAAIRLFDFRNRIAHAKPEFVKPDEVYLTQKQYDASQFKRSFPSSKLENKINLSNAQRAFTPAGVIKKILCDAIPPEDAQGLYVDSASGSFSLSE
ncbi:hypothetical protein [Nitrosospira sp. Nsp13]|uniref:hypothetical protein n=1 Tax=Nitrosospira sp. Nsp13 TaxID=1855332 RepID=UPI00111307A0|nr:hypothetical protein [Nitrosospira sp. Nsp13]